MYVLELFHGPTFAFKDVALQFLGNLYSYISKKTGVTINIFGATSGDTGASAIEGVRGKEGIRICILHPYGKVSKVQELQMTTVQDESVLNLAIKGTFDDGQRIIKELFADLEFKNKYHLRAINSINFARILAQTVYYFYAYFQVAKEKDTKSLNFSVPTGNFGDIFAGYLAKRMGLPVGKLIVATNENNILERFIKDGVYQPGEFRSTYSPSMDIQVASNFERYLYYLLDENTSAVSALMDQFKSEGKIVVNEEQLRQVKADFVAHGVDGEECLKTISKYYVNQLFIAISKGKCCFFFFYCLTTYCSGSGNYVALFSYYAILNLGVFAVAWFRTWRVLNVLGFVFTFTITGLWRATRTRTPSVLGRCVPDPVLPDVCRRLDSELRAPGAESEGLRLGLARVRLAGRRIHVHATMIARIEYGLAWSAFALGASTCCSAGVCTHASRDVPPARRSFRCARRDLREPRDPARFRHAHDRRDVGGRRRRSAVARRAQERKLPRLFGTLLQTGAGIGYLIGYVSLRSTQPILNSAFLGATMLAVSGVFSGYWLFRNEERRAATSSGSASGSRSGA